MSTSTLGVSWQSTLFAAGSEQWRDLDDARRVELGSGAWVDLVPGWLAGGAAIVPDLLRDVPWRRESRQMYDNVVDVPRLTAHYGRYADLPHPCSVRQGTG